MSALQPDKPLLDAWYLVTPEGRSSVRITDGLTFIEEQASEGRQLALALSCAEEGLIQFQVDASGVWLSVCHSEWQISGAQGVVSGPIPIFHPVDLHFRHSVVHLRADFSKLDCERVVELTLEGAKEKAHPTLSLRSVRHLQSQVDASEGNTGAGVRVSLTVQSGPHCTNKAAPTDKVASSPSDPKADISPLREPRIRKIPGEGLPSSLRLAPEPAARQDEVPLLTERVAPVHHQDLQPEHVAPESEDDAGIPPEEATGLPVVSNLLVTEAPSYLNRRNGRSGARIQNSPARRRYFTHLLAFVIGLLLVSTELPIQEFLVTESRDDHASPRVDLNLLGPKAVPTRVESLEREPQGRNLSSEVTPANGQAAPANQAENSEQLLVAVDALLAGDDVPDAATLQFAVDAFRVANETDSASAAAANLPSSVSQTEHQADGDTIASVETDSGAAEDVTVPPDSVAETDAGR